MAASSIGTGRFTTSIVDVIWRPRIIKESKPVIVYLHTAASNATESTGVTHTAVNPIITAICNEGYTIVAPTQPGASFGNDAAQTRISEAITYARSTLGCNNDDIILLGASMGSTAALRYAALNPTLVAGVITFLTVADLTDVYENDVNGNRAVVGTAYGVTYPTPLPANSDPATMTASLAGIPMLLHYSSDDNYTPPLADFITATGATGVNVGALDHTNASIAATNIPQVLNFIQSNT